MLKNGVYKRWKEGWGTMGLIDLYIRDKETGEEHRIGDNRHDMLVINEQGQLCYENLQNGDGCRTGETGGGYEFIPNVDKHGFNTNPLKDPWEGLTGGRG